METVKSFTRENLEKLGAEKVARFAACIYVNYLYYMNGGAKGYGEAQIKTIEAKETKRVLDNFDAYVDGVVKAVNSVAGTTTEIYFKKAYLKWFA